MAAPILGRQAECMVQINGIPELKLSLKDWDSNFKMSLERVENKRTRTMNLKNELYQLIGFYSVFQGVVLTAVAQASSLKCQTVWGPALLSALASLATLFSFHNKVTEYHSMKVDLKKEEDDAKAIDGVTYPTQIIKDKIRSLKLDATREATKDVEKFSTQFFSKLDDHVQKQLDKNERKYKDLLKKQYYWSYMILLVFFSVITLGSCLDILCSDSNLLHKLGSMIAAIFRKIFGQLFRQENQVGFE